MSYGTWQDLKKKLSGKKRFTDIDCPFCRDIPENPSVLWKGTHWYILINEYPYIHTGEHIMLIPIRHVRYSHELTSDEYTDINEAYRYIEDFYGDQDYFSFTRESMANRSVEHVHTHFLPGKLKREAMVTLLRDQGFDTFE